MMNHPNPTLPQFPAPLASEGASEEGRMPLISQYLHILRRRQWYVIAIVGLSIMAALVATLLMTPKYTATTRIEISREQKNVTNVQGVESEQVGRDLEFYQTQYSLLEAESLADRVMRRLRLDTVESFWQAHGVDPNNDSMFRRSQGVLSQQERGARRRAAISLLLENVAISPIRGSSLVDIEYTSASPEMSALIANAWTAEFIAQSVARRYDSTSEARRYLEERLAQLRTRLEQTQRDLANYASQKNIITLSSQPGPDGRSSNERTLAADTLESLNRALVQATADRVTAQARVGNAGSNSAGTGPAIAEMRNRRAEAAAEYARLMAQFEPGYPVARAREAQVRELDRAIAAEEARIRRGAAQDYAAAAGRENDLRQRVEALSSTLNQQRQDAIQYDILRREVETVRGLHDTLNQRYREIGVAGVAANNIAVIDEAQVPARPSSPNMLLNLILATMAGMGLALGAVFVLEQADEGLRDPTRVQELLGVPLLGSVPKATEDMVVPEELRDPKSLLSEAYLSIRSSLAFSTDHGVPHSMMMVSTHAAEGKSTSSLALASVLQRVGKRVILVDADLRNPSLHTTLGLDKGEGLSNYLAGEDNVQRMIRPLDSGVHFLSGGPAPPSAAELLSTERMFRLVRDLEGAYDHVIIDSPPILGLADAPLLSKTVEAVIFIVQAGDVAVRGLRSALARLRDVNAPVVGVILTKFESRFLEYGYGYGFRYRYGEGNESGSDTEN
jgi:succinoglycan biosynthesis transport protein ExoP